MNKTLKKRDMYEKLTYFTQLERLINENNINIVVDKLRLCYRVIDNTIIKELELKRPDVYHLFDFDLIRVDGKYHNDIYKIVYNDYDNNNNIVPHEFGELRFNLKAEMDNDSEEDKKTWQKAWIYVNNYILYGDTKIIHLEYISAALGLKLNNVTNIEIAIDTNKNIPKRYKALIRNKAITTILNGNTILDRKEDRPEFEFIHSGDMDRYKYLTIYTKQRKAIKNKANGTIICTYDKKKECQNSAKDYILDYYDNPNKLFRLEVRVGNENFKNYLNSQKIELIEQLFWNKGFLLETFEYFLSSVIRFKRGKEYIPIWEILY